MKKEQFLEVMNEIDDEFIIDAKKGKVNKRSHRIFKIAAVAACLCLTMVAVIGIPFLNKGETTAPYNGTAGEETLLQKEPSQGESENKTPQVITAFETKKMVGDYAMPEASEVRYTAAVGDAFDEYRDEEACFLLAFNVFKDNELLMGEELNDEYQRLSDLGYKLYLIEDHWSYHGKGEKLYSPIVAGLFTIEEITDFKTDENYGYFFYFARNGDGSPISFDGAEVITDFDVPYV